jgi:hypothetical protein
VRPTPAVTLSPVFFPIDVSIALAASGSLSSGRSSIATLLSTTTVFGTWMSIPDESEAPVIVESFAFASPSLSFTKSAMPAGDRRP